MTMQYMENHAQEVSVARMNWQQVQERLAAEAVVLLPIGAACKEHGLHPPMNTDFVQVEWFARQLAQDEHIIIWPVLAYGSHVDEFENSIILMIACGLVNMDKTVCCDTKMQAGVLNPYSPALANYSAS